MAAAPASARLSPLPGELPGGGAMALDRLIHERLRLGIVSILAAHESLRFIELKQLLRTTDGNLSVHLKTLQEAGYVAVSKSYQGNRPLTTCSLTAAGRKAFTSYINLLEQIVQQSRPQK